MSGHTKEYEVRLLHTRTREETVTVHAESPEDARDQIDEMLAVQFIAPVAGTTLRTPAPMGMMKLPF